MFLKLGAVLLLVVHVCSAADFDWCSLTCKDQKHTMCLYKDGGGDSCAAYKKGFTAEEKKLILDYHNELRAKVANGQETTGPQPKAADMNELVWDDEVAEIAQRWVEQCEQPGGHDKCRITKDKEKVGQNYAETSGYGMSVDRKATIKDLVKSWYDEVKDMQPSVVGGFKSSGGAVIGHYTQLVWGKTTRLGCGLAHKQEGENGAFEVRLICNYKTAGNFLGHPVYTEGEPASKCTKQSTKYQGLCEPEEKTDALESDSSASASSGESSASDSNSDSSSSQTSESDADSDTVSTSDSTLDSSSSTSGFFSTSDDDSGNSNPNEGATASTKPSSGATATSSGSLKPSVTSPGSLKPSVTSSGSLKPSVTSFFSGKPLSFGLGSLGSSSFQFPGNVYGSANVFGFPGFQTLPPLHGTTSGFQQIPGKFLKPSSFFAPLPPPPMMNNPVATPEMDNFYSLFLNSPGQNKGNSNTAFKIFRWH